MWRVNERGEKEFSGGMEDWSSAVTAASSCGSFHPDVEEELVTDDPVSCYNCRFRRWTAASFACCGFLNNLAL